jgi:hypothetical protein
MKGLQRLLLDRLDRHRLNATAALGLKEGLGVGAIGLVATHVGVDILDGQKAYPQIARLTPPAPIVRRTAPFHDHFGARRQRVDEALELPSRQPLPLGDSIRTIRHCYFEDVLCQIHGDRRSIHLGLLLVAWCDPRFTAMMPRKNREESMPSLQPTAEQRRLFD